MRNGADLEAVPDVCPVHKIPLHKVYSFGVKKKVRVHAYLCKCAVSEAVPPMSGHQYHETFEQARERVELYCK